MRHLLLSLFAALFLFACGSPIGNNTTTDITPTSTTTHSPTYQSGDLIFVSLPLTYRPSMPPDSISLIMSQIDAPTQCIHVAIVERLDDSIFIIDASLKHGVARYPLHQFLSEWTLRNGQLPILQLMRLHDTLNTHHFISNATNYLGQPYDTDLDIHNNAQYCSELVRNSFVTTSGDTLFAITPIDFTEGRDTLSPYWAHLLSTLKTTSPQGKPGILPEQIKKDSRLYTIGIITSAE